MARIRSTKPEFWADQELCALPRDVRALYHALWNFADEEARAQGDPRLVKSNCFPLDDDLTPEVIDGMLNELAKGAWVVRYVVGGAQYIYLPKLSKHQRLEPERVPSRLPAPPESASLSAVTSRANGSSPRLDESAPRALNMLPATCNSTGVGVQGEGGDDFEVFWEAYPNKQSKPEARRAFRAAKVPLDQLMAGLRGWCDYWGTKESEFVPYPQKFLRQRKWEDKPPARAAPRSAVPANIDEMAKFAARKAGTSSTNGKYPQPSIV